MIYMEEKWMLQKYKICIEGYSKWNPFSQGMVWLVREHETTGPVLSSVCHHIPPFNGVVCSTALKKNQHHP